MKTALPLIVIAALFTVALIVLIVFLICRQVYRECRSVIRLCRDGMQRKERSYVTMKGDIVLMRREVREEA